MRDTTFLGRHRDPAGVTTGAPMNTRTIAVAALILVVIVLAFLLL